MNHWFYQDENQQKGDISSTVMLQFGIVQLILSQLPSLEKITWLSIMSAIMSFAYSFIGLGLSVAKWIVRGHIGLSEGAIALSRGGETWNSLQALGNIAFAYTFAEVLIEIQVYYDNSIKLITFKQMMYSIENTLRSCLLIFLYFRIH
jgi:Transmembrane amino acid transporter protein